MIDLFKTGGPLFMGILTGLLFIILVLSAYFLVLISRKDYKNIEETRKKLKYIKSIGFFTLITGILGQMVGLYEAFDAVEKAMDISPSIMAGGLRVSMITPMYGMIILLISYLLWMLTDYLASREA